MIVYNVGYLKIFDCNYFSILQILLHIWISKDFSLVFLKNLTTSQRLCLKSQERDFICRKTISHKTENCRLVVIFHVFESVTTLLGFITELLDQKVINEKWFDSISSSVIKVYLKMLIMNEWMNWKSTGRAAKFRRSVADCWRLSVTGTVNSRFQRLLLLLLLSEKLSV